MNRIFRITALVVALFGSLSMFADDITSVYVRTATGDAEFPLSQLTEVKFPADGQIAIVTTSGTQTFSTANGLISLRFDKDHSAVEKISFKEDGLRLNGRVLQSPTDGIEVFSLDGVLRKAGNGSTLDLSELVNGVYVARSGSLTLKIMLR